MDVLRLIKINSIICKAFAWLNSYIFEKNRVIQPVVKLGIVQTVGGSAIIKKRFVVTV